MKSGNYTVGLSSLHEVLSDNRHYVVPDYQRRYRWDESKVDELWDDVVSLYKDPDQRKNEYLLGSIVTARHGDDSVTEIVIDGQQRLVSLTLMFCAIRNVLINNFEGADANLKSELSNLVSSINERVLEKQKTFIKLNHTADKSLLDHICNAGVQDENYKKLKGRASKTIHKNYDELCKRANALCESLKITNGSLTGIDELKKILKAVTNRVCVIDITVENENDAQQIFEALNSKGQQLTQSDLIKSHLIQKSHDAKKDWDGAFSLFEKEIKDNPRKSDEYVYYSLLSRDDSGKDIGKRELYKAVKTRVINESSANEFIAELKEDIEIIHKLEHPSDLLLEHRIHGLKQVNAVYFRRPIMAAIRTWKWNDQRTVELIDFLLKFFFMYRSICKMDVDKIRSIARDITIYIINKGDKLQIEELLTKLSDVAKKAVGEGPSENLDLDAFHDRFLKSFLNLDYDSRGVIMYIFISIEQLLQKGQFVVPTKGFDIEHIFPQKADIDAWPNRAELKLYKNNIGNLTLLPHRWNSKLRNYSFVIKKTGIKDNGEKIVLRGRDSKDENGEPIVCSYNNSNLKINNDMQKCDKWGLTEIMKRQSLLKKYASEIWDLREYS